MTFEKTFIENLIICKTEIYCDQRGSFYESFKQNEFNDFVGQEIVFCQENESISQKNVLRGLHFQTGNDAQAKLVRVVSGSVLDVAVDIRKQSPTFGRYFAIELNDINKFQLFIPRGFAHGFLVLSKEAIFNYKVDNFYNKKSEGGIIYNDTSLAIDWPISEANIIVSEKDSKLPNFLNSYHF